MALCCGCSTISFPERPKSSDYYSNSDDYQLPNKLSGSSSLVRMTVDKMPIRDFCVMLSREYNVSIVYSNKLESETVSGDFVNVPYDEVLGSVAKSLGQQLIHSGRNLFYIGELSDDERACFVTIVYGFTPEDVKKSVETISGYSGKCYVSPNGVLVVTDKESIVNRVAMMINEMSKYPPDTYILQLYLVSFKDEKSLNLGLELYTTGDLSYFIAQTAIKGVANTFGHRFSQVITGKCYGSKVISSPMMLLCAGRPCEWVNGSSIPVPNKTVSDSGTVTTSGYSNVDVGLKIKALLTVNGNNSNMIELDLEDSSVLSYVEYNPVKSQTKYKTSFTLRNYPLYLVGELNRNSDSRGLNSFFTFKHEHSTERIVIFARCYKIGDYIHEDN